MLPCHTLRICRLFRRVCHADAALLRVVTPICLRALLMRHDDADTPICAAAAVAMLRAATPFFDGAGCADIFAISRRA